MILEMTEDRLVQHTVAEYFEQELGWESVFAFNQEQLGTRGTLGRASQKEVILTRYLRQALEKLNPDLPETAYASAIQQITEFSTSKSMVQSNKEKYALFKNGVQVTIRNASGRVEKKRLRVFDFSNPENNHFVVVRELWVQGHPYRRRPDILGFVNGIPLLFIELKNVHRNIRHAYDENLSDYKDTIPHLFDYTALIFLSNGDTAKVGSITSKYEHFHEWKRLEEEDPGVVDMETLLKGMCSKSNFMDLFENFIVFDDSSGKLVKIVARNHQYLGVNRAVDSVRRRHEKNGQLGVFWHTQGSGKSYSMVFFSQKVHRKLSGNFTFLIVTDREDLDKQIYKTYVGTEAVSAKVQCRAASGDHLERLFQGDQPYVFTMIHKFNKAVDPEHPYTKRDDVIVISDEAHRTQYGKLALNMHDALPNAHYIGFTGTPLFKDDEITKRIFGGYISTYDFQRAVDDNATVPLFYDNRGEKLQLATTSINEKLAEKMEELELDSDQDQQALLEKELGREYHIITAQHRLDRIAQDFVEHYTTQWETGKAMFVCIDKLTAVRMHELISAYWGKQIKQVEKAVRQAIDEQEEIYLRRQLAWLKETEIAVVVSEEQGEVQRFRTHGLDIVPHRKLIKEGFETPDGRRVEIDTAFKDADHPFRVAIVCAMWMTGFDVPSLSSLYLDKPLKAHTLMQAIARANRVYEEKNNGLIIDYCGILKNLRQALATFAVGETGSGTEIETDPVKPEEELIAELEEAITETTAYLHKQGFTLDDIITTTGFAKINAIKRAKEAVNENDETRKRFEILARIVFRKFKSCITIPAINQYRAQEAAIDVIYKKLQEDREKADISQIIQELHSILDTVIIPSSEPSEDKDKLYDISKIDFERLKEEFGRHAEKRTLTQSLKDAVEKRLQQMIAQNPLRVDFYKHYQAIIADYNREKDRATIEATFAALLKFVGDLDEEEQRHVREDLSEEHLALFDILVQGKELKPQQREAIKRVARELLESLKETRLRIDRWREKEATKAAVKTFIHDFLYDEIRGLPPEAYTFKDVDVKTEFVFDHIYTQYPSYHQYQYAA